MANLNLDTHILVFLLQGRLTAAEERLIRVADVAISAVVLWELWKLNSLGKIKFNAAAELEQAVLSQFRVLPVDAHVCAALAQLDFRSDPADELIAATSVAHGVPLMTRDRRIRASKVVPLAA
ncbi:MAG: type II toxin-antitoxin system VapC family toxin [Acidobacteria bacterium]|nr:type II toxin-antitoxin system VapC family toxin [Acidobacteriota bacterium]